MTDLDVDAARLVVERLGPWSRISCACVNRTWKRAVEQVMPFPDPWLVDAVSSDSLRMYNLFSGNEKVVKINLPLEKTKSVTVLCSFRGLIVIGVDSQFFLGDPLLNKWIELFSPDSIDPTLSQTAAFCSETDTLMILSGCTATFDLTTAEWNIDKAPSHDFNPVGRACCLGGIFYCAFMNDFSTLKIKCYDPVYHRKWRVVSARFSEPYDVFLLGTSHDKMLVYVPPDDDGDDDYYEEDDDDQLFERAACDVEVVPAKNKLVNNLIKSTYNREETRLLEELDFHGEDDMFFIRKEDKIRVLSIKDGISRDLNCSARPSTSICYYVAASGTAELLDDLELKLKIYCK